MPPFHPKAESSLASAFDPLRTLELAGAIIRAEHEVLMSFVVIRGDDLFADLPPQEAADKVRELVAEDKGEVFLQDAFGDPWGLEELIQGYRLDRDAKP